jgi:hypothetical protein
LPGGRGEAAFLKGEELMRRKLIVLGLALMGFVGTLCLQPRVAEASSCGCQDAACCNWCCTLSSGKVICSERPCIAI